MWLYGNLNWSEGLQARRLVAAEAAATLIFAETNRQWRT
jgi:hypothetical protein